MTGHKAERRKDPRRDGNLPLKISKQGLDMVTETRNISSSGVYCRVNQPLPVMTKIELTLLLPQHTKNRISSEKIKCGGVVVRSEPDILEQADKAYQSVAIFFTDISKKNKEKISQYVFESFKNANKE